MQALLARVSLASWAAQDQRVVVVEEPVLEVFAAWLSRFLTFSLKSRGQSFSYPTDFLYGLAAFHAIGQLRFVVSGPAACPPAEQRACDLCPTYYYASLCFLFLLSECQ